MSDLNQGIRAENVPPVSADSRETEQRQEPLQQGLYQQTQQQNQPQQGEISVGMWTGAPAMPAGGRSGAVRPDTEETKRFRGNYVFFSLASFVYAVFYAFCMFKNGSGITFPFFVGGGLVFLCLSLPKLGLTLKKGSAFYMAAILLLAVSTFCTDDGRIIFFNKLGIFLLMMSLLLKQFHDTSKWQLGKFLLSIVETASLSVAELGRPFSDRRIYKRSRSEKSNKKLAAVGIGLLISVPLLLVVLLLLSGADAVFRQMTRGLLENISIANIMNVMLRIAFIYFASYALLSCLCAKNVKDEVKDRRTGEPLIAITVTSLLTVLYLVFSVIQIVGLFLGRLTLPEGYTYAMYAREGFFQLLAVAFLNLVIVLICISLFRESRILKGILTAMSVCTFIMIASSAMRMIIYIYFYYLTFMRLLVLWGLLLLTFLFLGVVINIFKGSFPMFRYSVAVVTVLYLALAFARPDYVIARVNVANAANAPSRELKMENFQDRSPFHDYGYLCNLSADAAPVLVPYLQRLGYNMEAYKVDNPPGHMRKYFDLKVSWKEVDGFGYYWMDEIKERTEKVGVRTFNVSRYAAKRLLEKAAGGE